MGFSFRFASTRTSTLFGKAGPSVWATWSLQKEKRPDQEEYMEKARRFTERYSVYALFWGRHLGLPSLLRGDVTHPEWPLQAATLDFLEAESLFAAAGFPGLPVVSAAEKQKQPHVCFSRGVGHVEFWMLEPV